MPMSVALAAAAAAAAVSGGMNPANTHFEFYKDHCNKYLNDSFVFPFFQKEWLDKYVLKFSLIRLNVLLHVLKK